MATQTQSPSKTDGEPRETPAEQRAHLHAILTKLDDVMFLTFTQVGPTPSLAARPLHVTKVDDDNGLWFVVGLDSQKVADVRRTGRALVTGQDSRRWLHLSGSAEVVTDKAKVRALWSKAFEIYFPDGPEDPNVGLIHVRPEAAEYWDSSGTPGLRYLVEAARAFVTGTPAQPVKGVHGEVGKA